MFPYFCMFVSFTESCFFSSQYLNAYYTFDERKVSYLVFHSIFLLDFVYLILLFCYRAIFVDVFVLLGVWLCIFIRALRLLAVAAPLLRFLLYSSPLFLTQRLTLTPAYRSMSFGCRLPLTRFVCVLAAAVLEPRVVGRNVARWGTYE